MAIVRADPHFTRNWRPFRVAAVVAAGVWSGMMLAVRIVGGDVPFPACGFKMLTGIPCPGCGATHSLAFLAGGEFSKSFSTNPLVSLVALSAFFAVPVLWLFVRSGGIQTVRMLSDFTARRGFRWTMAGLIGANWLYLILRR